MDQSVDIKPRIRPRCAICSGITKVTSTTCTTCNSAFYCSSECHETDRSLHEFICARYHAFTQTLEPRPKNTVLGIKFGNEDAAPEFIWVHFLDVTTVKDGLTLDRPQLQRYLHVENERVVMHKIDFNTYRGTELEKTIVLFNAPLSSFKRPGAKIEGCFGGVNRCMNELVKDFDAKITWRGTHIMLCMDEEAEIGSTYVDISLDAFRAMVDHLRHFDLSNPNPSTAHNLYNSLGANNIVMGVKINCEAEMLANGCNTFTTAKIPRDHPIFKMSTYSSIATQIGIPLLLSQTNMQWQWEVGSDLFVNAEATEMMTNIDPKDKHKYGRVEAGWEGEIGSVLVVREDGRDITPKQVEGIAAFCGMAGVGGNIPLEIVANGSKKKVSPMYEITKGDFEIFLGDYNMKKGASDLYWRDVESPY